MAHTQQRTVVDFAGLESRVDFEERGSCRTVNVRYKDAREEGSRERLESRDSEARFPKA